MNYSGEKSNKSIPVVTVYIPCKDYGHYLHVAVKSVLAQLFTDWELLIIDEASTDDTTIIAKQFVQKHPIK